ncbi:hypothetical protein [Runella sp.]|jgi:hypothetical protein|nr:hypothetical protein [Runella sp.]
MLFLLGGQEITFIFIGLLIWILPIIAIVYFAIRVLRVLHKLEKYLDSKK